MASTPTPAEVAALTGGRGLATDWLWRRLVRQVIRRHRRQVFLVVRRAMQLAWRFFAWSISPRQTYLLWWRHLVGLVSVYGLYRGTEMTLRGLETLWQRAWLWFWIRRGSQRHQRLHSLAERLESAGSHAEWREAALELDRLEGRHPWKDDAEDQPAEAQFFNAERLRETADLIQEHMDANDVRGLIRLLRSRLQRNFGGLTHESLYAHLRVGTKTSVERYIRTVRRALQFLARHSQCSLREKLAAFKETRHAFGRTALLLSGGGQLGLFHIGVVRALVEADLLPQVICGSSVGAVFASLIASRSDEDLVILGEPGTIKFDFFPVNRGNILQRLKRIMQSGFLMDIDVLIRCLRDNIGDITFQEAYDRFGRIVNISVTPSDNSEPLLLNFLTAPNVLLWSAAAASCAIPLVYRSVQLLAKDELGQIVPWLSSGVSFVDGSVKSDLPMERLRELFNINHFVVSQVNPHVVPFLFQPPPDGFPFIAAFQRFVVHFGRYVLHSLILFLSLLSPLGGDVGLARVAQVFMNLSTQVYTADITLVPSLSWRDYTQLMKNPTEARLKACVSMARRYTWRQVSRLFAHCEIEFELDNWVAELRREAIRQRRQSPTPTAAATDPERRDASGPSEAPTLPPVVVITGASRQTSPSAAAAEAPSPPGSARTIAGSPASVLSGAVSSASAEPPPPPPHSSPGNPRLGSPQPRRRLLPAFEGVPEEPGEGSRQTRALAGSGQNPKAAAAKTMVQPTLNRNSESQKQLRAINRVRSWSTWDLDEHGEPLLQDSGSQAAELEDDVGHP